MDIDDKLYEFRKIQQVDAPPFLLTRIKQRLKTLEHEPAPVQWRVTFTAATIIVFLFNVFIFFSHAATEKKPGINTVINAMNLSNTNELYHE